MLQKSIECLNELEREMHTDITYIEIKAWGQAKEKWKLMHDGS